jgi:hypothetical protein
MSIALMSDRPQTFISKLTEAATQCALAAKSFCESEDLLQKALTCKINARLERAKIKNSDAKDCIEKAREFESERASCKKLAENCKRNSQIFGRNACTIFFFHPQFDLAPFRNLLFFLQRLSPKEASETLYKIIVIVTNPDIKAFIKEEEEKIAKGKKSLYAVGHFTIMEFVVKNALFCEKIRVNHKLNFSTKFLRYDLASLQYQGKMAQMRSIAFERLEMFKKQRHNLLTISAFLYFFFRSIFNFPGNFVSLPMRSLLSRKMLSQREIYLKK